MRAKKVWFIPATPNVVNPLPELENKEISFKELYPIIGCSTIEHVGLKKGVDMWCDEKGLLIDNPTFNPEATRLYRAAYPHIAPDELAIFGNVIITDNTKAGTFIN